MALIRGTVTPGVVVSPNPNPMKPAVNCLHTAIWSLEKFIEHPKNPNTHPAVQLKKLGEIIIKAGWRNAIVVSSLSGLVIKGHGRLQAARMAGLTEAPVEIQEYASTAAELADLIADNRLAELSETDQFTVHGVLEDLNKLGDGLLAQTGFSDEDFAAMEKEIMAGLEAPQVRLPRTRTQTTALSNTVFVLGPIRFEVLRDDYLRWHEQIRSAVGYEKRVILGEIKRRLGMKNVAIK